MDKIVSKIAALGVPGLVLTVAIGATGLAGGAAITTALAAIGPGGMIKELYRRGETKEQLKQKIKRYPISKDLKRKLNEYIERS